MGRHSKPTPPPLYTRLPLPALTEHLGAKTYLFAAAIVGTPLGAAVVGWWL